MVENIVKLNKEADKIINMVKAKYGLKNKSQAINIMAKRVGMIMLEPEVRPEYIEKLERIRKHGKFVKVKDFAKEFGLKKR